MHCCHWPYEVTAEKNQVMISIRKRALAKDQYPLGQTFLGIKLKMAYLSGYSLSTKYLQKIPQFMGKAIYSFDI